MLWLSKHTSYGGTTSGDGKKSSGRWCVLLCAWRVWERAGDADTNKKRETRRAPFRAAVCKCVIKVSNKRVGGRERKNIGPR